MTSSYTLLVPVLPISDEQAERLTRLQTMASLAVAPLQSSHSRRVYGGKLRDFLARGLPLTRDGVLAWVQALRDNDAKSATLTQAISAVKRLADEAELRGLLDPMDAHGIRRIETPRRLGIRAGNWLTMAGAQKLISLPDRKKQKGMRDAAALALLLGCGLRREEACRVTWRHWQIREGRACIVDLVGKGGRVRTVPAPKWATWDLDMWMDLIKSKGWYAPGKPILHALKVYGEAGSSMMLVDRPLTSQGVWYIVGRYARRLGMERISPHDLRRTLARLLLKAGAKWEQIQFILGHASLITTQKYVGDLELDEGAAAVDLIQW